MKRKPMSSKMKASAAKKRLSSTKKRSTSRTARSAMSRSKLKQSAKSKPAMESNFYHIMIHPRGQFASLRKQSILPGHIMRVSGKRKSGSWTTFEWLINKKDAKVVNGYLRPSTSKKIKEIFSQLKTTPRRKEGDIFTAKGASITQSSKKKVATSKRKPASNKKKRSASLLRKMRSTTMSMKKTLTKRAHKQPKKMFSW